MAVDQFIYRVGTAKLAIPYPEDFFPYHSWGPRRLTGVHDDLCVRVIYLSAPGELLLVSLENGDIDPLWVTKLAEVSGVAEENILISATHTHTAPYIGGYWPEDVDDVEKSEKYTVNAWNTMVEAVRKAMSKTEPACLQYGVGSCDVNVNRDMPVKDPETGRTVYRVGKNIHGYSDKNVYVMCFSRESGETAAVLFNYAVHSSILFAANMKDGGQLASGDLAGCAMDRVEKFLGHGAVAMYTLAPAADQNARHNATFTYVDEKGEIQHGDYGAGSYIVVDLLGGELADEVLHVCEGLSDSRTAEHIQTVTETIFVPGKAKKEGPHHLWPQSPAEYEPSDPVPLPLAVTAIGDMAIVSIGCELSSVNAPEIKRIVSEKGFRDTVIITQCNGSSSYMSDPRGYQVVTFSAKASHMMPEAVNCLFAGVERLAAQAAMTLQKA